jgi:hypothetical protein
VNDFKSSIIESYKHCYLPSLIDNSNANSQRDFFLFFVFCYLYDSTEPTVKFELCEPFQTIENFNHILLSVKNNNSTNSAVSQCIELIEEQIRGINSIDLVEDINRLVIELSGLANQQKKLTKVEAIGRYREALLPLQQMNVENIHDIEVEPLRLSPVYFQLLNVMKSGITKKRMYLPFDVDAEASISILDSEPSQAVDVESVEQSPLHILRFLALLHSADVNVLNSHCLQPGYNLHSNATDLAVKLTKLPKVINKGEIKDKDAALNTGNNKDKNKEPELNKDENKLPRYPEFDVANVLTSALSKKGTGYIFLVQNALSRQSDAESRSRLVKSGCVSAVVTLPQKLFSQQTYELVLIILKRNSQTVRFIDAVDFYTVSDKKHVLARLDELKNLIDTKEEVKGRSFHVPLNIIINNNSSLHPVAYKDLYWLEDAGIEELKSQRLNLLDELGSTQNNIDKLVNKFIG